MKHIQNGQISSVFIRKTLVCNMRVAAKMIFIFFATSLLINCGSSSSKKELTLGSLSQGLPKINPQALPSAKASSARSSYKKLAKTADDKDLRARALERLADLQLESAIAS